jgi:hypothetical protein
MASLTWWTKEVFLSVMVNTPVIVNTPACGYNCHPSKYFACLTEANVNRQFGLHVCRCCPCSSSAPSPTPLFSRFLSTFSSSTVSSVPLPPLLLSLFPSPFSSPAEFIFSEVLAILQISVGSVSYFVFCFVTFVCDSVRSAESGSECIV